MTMACNSSEDGFDRVYELVDGDPEALCKSAAAWHDG
jgi:hypothetical protein